MTKLLSAFAFCLIVSAAALAQSEYRVLATSKTSTMAKEMNEAGAAGYKFVSLMGGETAGGGKEVVVLMQRGGDVRGTYRYQLLATSRTSSLQNEINQAALNGYDYVGQTVFESMFGGEEVVSIVERGPAMQSQYIYKVFATSRTSTLMQEINEAGRDGFEALGMTVGKTAFGGDELVVIARKRR